MSEKRISIDLCRVDSDTNSVNIQVLATCPSDDLFVGCKVYCYFYKQDKKTWDAIPSTTLDFSMALEEYNATVSDPSNLTVTLPIPMGADHEHGIYHVELTTQEELQADAYVSDVTFVYDCMLEHLICDMNNCCSSIPDDVIRMYLLLYGHTTAMQLDRLDQAKYFYGKLLSCGGPCKPRISNSCNCH